MRTIGVSCFYHDSAVVAIENGEIRFAIQEERLSRVKHDARFPQLALQAALLHCGWKWDDVDQVFFHEDPDFKFERVVAQARDGWPGTWNYWRNVIPYHYHHKRGIETHMRLLGYNGPIYNAQHHRSHAAATFFTSPFERALVLVIDGVGEWDTLTVWNGEGNNLHRIQSISFPHSLGLLYSVMTNYLGFRSNNGEFKVMGLAAMGDAFPLADRLLENILLLNADGSFGLDQKYFDWCNPHCHHTPALEKLLGVPPRKPGGPIEQEHMDLAAAVQYALETTVLRMVQLFLGQGNHRNLCMAGGVTLNCVLNAMILRCNPDLTLWIQPAAGDAGCAMGAAIIGDLADCAPTNVRRYPFTPYLGIDYPDRIIEQTLADCSWFPQQESNAQEIARQLAQGKIVALYQGRDEWGNRALGNRTILADPRDARMKDRMNAKVKFREAFRPFAPVVMDTHAKYWFETFNSPSAAHMMLTHQAYNPDHVPAVVHVNGMSRIQTVSETENPFLFEILTEFHRLTHVPLLMNTSFNLRGEPIVSSPYDAMQTFEQSGIDTLAFGRWFMLEKEGEPC